MMHRSGISRSLSLGALLVFVSGCLPAKGEVTIYGDGIQSTEAGSAGGSDGKLLAMDGQGGPDGKAAAKADGAASGSDSKSPPGGGPKPPFGKIVSTTAYDFSGIPDCADQPYRLYDYYGKTKGVLIAMMSPACGSCATVSRWLQQQVLAKYPDLTLFDVLVANYGVQAGVATCQSWTQNNSLSHPVLRDKGGAGSIGSSYGMVLSDLMIVDRHIKIVFRAKVTDTLSMNQVLSALSQLP